MDVRRTHTGFVSVEKNITVSIFSANMELLPVVENIFGPGVVAMIYSTNVENVETDCLYLDGQLLIEFINGRLVAFNGYGDGCHNALDVNKVNILDS